MQTFTHDISVYIFIQALFATRIHYIFAENLHRVKSQQVCANTRNSTLISSFAKQKNVAEVSWKDRFSEV